LIFLKYIGSFGRRKIDNEKRTGLVIIYTGSGKGKTTAALGMLLRAWGHDFRAVVLQYIKRPDSVCGEHYAFQRLGWEVVTMGSGFTWVEENGVKNEALSKELWNITKEKINSQNYEMLLLDEFTYPLQYGWIQIEEVLEVLKNRPRNLHVIITGRNAPQKLLDFADTVMQIEQIKHHLQKGIKAQPGIEY
jgi:cob(I)alamin adenosyltransferase